MYIELDHALVPRKRKDIHSTQNLSGRGQKEDEDEGKEFGYLKKRMRKYPLKYGNTQNIFLEFEKGKQKKKLRNFGHFPKPR